MNHAVRVAASLLLSAFFLWLAARDISWAEVSVAFRDARLVWVIPMVLTSAVSLGFRALRWGVLVRPIAPASARSLFAATSIGFAANMLLPLRAGEVLRPWVLARRETIRFPQALATVAVERLFDMATLLLLFALATFALPLPPEWRRYGWFFLATFAMFLVLLFVLRRTPDLVFGAVRASVGRFSPGLGDRIIAVIAGFSEGLVSLGSAAPIVKASVYSVCVWLTNGLSFACGFPAFGIDAPWMRGALTVTTFVAIAVSVPGGPGFIGMFQVGCVVALAVFGVGKSVGFSYSVLVHVVQFATTVALGVYFFLREGFRMDELREASGETAPRAAAAGD
jgi:glycosyltransferase 2 family protein